MMCIGRSIQQGLTYAAAARGETQRTYTRMNNDSECKDEGQLRQEIVACELHLQKKQPDDRPWIRLEDCRLIIASSTSD